MLWPKKYASIFVLLTVFPIAWIVGRNFVTDTDTSIYEFIPQECDIVIEVNNVNFISEFLYQRIYHESYLMERINFEEVETNTGIDYFSKIVLFREQWAEENIWMAVLAYSDREHFQRYTKMKMKDSHTAFGDKYAIVQLSESLNQAQMDERLKQIANGDIKPFTTRIDLPKYFKSDKEINCYFIPPATHLDNQLIDGHLSFDFQQDHVDIKGDFTPVGGFGERPSIAYALNKDVAFSMRSSLNIFNSIYWFSKERIDNVPEYTQMALDYDGVNMFMVDRSFGYQFPFKTFPELALRFDIINSSSWHAFFDTLEAQERFLLDTTTGSLVTEYGAFFQYVLNDRVFELSQSVVELKASSISDICFDLQIKIAPLLDNTKFAVDEKNHPGIFEQTFGMALAEEMLADLHVLENVEQIKFQLIKNGDSSIKAVGGVQMLYRDGQSIIESVLFARESIYFIKQALEVVDDL